MLPAAPNLGSKVRFTLKGKNKRTRNQNEEGMEKCEKRDGAIEQREETETKGRERG